MEEGCLVAGPPRVVLSRIPYSQPPPFFRPREFCPHLADWNSALDGIQLTLLDLNPHLPLLD
jgi:hypothetical protein